MKNMDRRLKKIIFLLITMLLTMLFLLLYTIYSYKYAYVNGNVIRAEDEKIIIYDEDKEGKDPITLNNLFPGDSKGSTYYVEVNYVGEGNLYFGITDISIVDENGDSSRSLTDENILSEFNVEVSVKSDKPEVIPEPDDGPVFADDGLKQIVNCTLSDLVIRNGRISPKAGVKVEPYGLSSENEIKETITYNISIKLNTEINDNYSLDDNREFYNDGDHSIQGEKINFTMKWFTDLDSEEEGGGGGGHLIPETGIFGLRLNKKQTTYFYFILAILLLLAIIVYKKIKEKQEKNNGRE